MKEKWSNLNIKEKLAIISAITAFIAGWGLTIAGFCLPPMGDVTNSVLWILSQALIYTASVFGVTSYFNAESVKLRRDVDKHIEKMERLQLERMKIRKGIDEGEIPEREVEDGFDS